MPRHLGTLLAALALMLGGCNSPPPPGQHPDSGTDAGPDAGLPADAGRSAGSWSPGQVDPIWERTIVSDPPGISIDACGGSANTLSAQFPVGAAVTLRATPCSVPAQVYDFSWTGGCAGTGTSVEVDLTSDVSCHLHLTPTSTR
jgi:hypothetical protein